MRADTHPLARLARFAAGRPWLVLAVLAVLVAAGLGLALGLQPSTGADTLVGKGSDSGRATSQYHKRFGDDAVVVLVHERLPNLVDTDDLGRLINLEGCLGGKVPSGRKPFGARGGPCWKLAAHRPVKTVYGPGTFLNEAATQVNAQLQARLQAGSIDAQEAGAAAAQDARKRGQSKAQQAQAAREAQQLAQTQTLTQLQQLAVATGIEGLPSITNTSFVNRIVFDAERGADTPKARFAYLFPSKDSAIVQVRLKAGLSEPAKRRAIGWIRDAVDVKDPKTHQPLFAPRRGGSYTVTGVPVVVQDLADRVAGAMILLLVGAVLVMGLVLLAVFRARLRLLPLLSALAATALTYGVLRLVGGSLTLAMVAVLPVLIGLAVDYAVQFQSRVEEEDGDPARGAAAGARTLATAALATAVGFTVLVLSPVPMVRAFGLVLVLGVGLALVCTFAGGAAVLSLTRGRRPGPTGAFLASARAGAGAIVASVPGVRRGARAGRAGARRLLGAAVARPRRVLVLAVVLAVAGWVADTQTRVNSDVTKLVPQDTQALRDVGTLQRETGIAGEVDVLVRGEDVTDPAVVRWMATYQKRVLARFGYSEKRGCRRATLCPSLSLADLLQTPNAAPATAGQVRRLLAAVPPYFSQSVISADHKRANLAFGIPLLPLAEQEKVIATMRDELDPPAGAHADLAGLPVEVADANGALSSPWRRLGTLLAGLLGVGFALWIVFRRLRRAVVPLIPIALATGWAALIITPFSLNPLSATLGAMVIAIATEFSVLLSERYREERGRGHAADEALRRSYRSTGAAILASGLTVIAGFGVLVLSDISLLRNFGLVTVLDLGMALAGVLLVLPAVLALEERGELAPLPRGTLRRLRPRRRRAPGGVTGPPPPRPPAGISRYSWFVGVVGVLLLAYIAVNTFRTSGGGAGVAKGGVLPPFAIPLLGSDLDGDANVARHAGQGAGTSKKVTACAVDDPRALNFYRLAAGHRVVLAFVSVRQEDSLRQLDAMAAAARRHPEIRFLAVFLRGDRGDARRAASDRGWRFPLGWDREGDVAALYGVKALPAVTFANARRRELATAYHYLSPARLDDELRQGAGR